MKNKTCSLQCHPPPPSTMLFDLPDSCLLAVLQHVADHPASLFSAARAHSRLHQAAAQALSSINAAMSTQQHADSLLLYLERHGQHVHTLQAASSSGPGCLPIRIALRQLPHSSLQQLQHLSCAHMMLQLLPGDGFQGVLVPTGTTTLRLLQVEDCRLLDKPDALAAAALPLLPPCLEHFSFSVLGAVLPVDVLRPLQRLTALELSGWALNGALAAAALPLLPPCLERLSLSGLRRALPVDVLTSLQRLTALELSHCQLVCSPAVQGSQLLPLQGLTNLRELRLMPSNGVQAPALLSAAEMRTLQQLTRLEVSSGYGYCTTVEAAALQANTQLRHLVLVCCSCPQGELLSSLQSLQQLTHLELNQGGCPNQHHCPADYAALTASSELRHLALTGCTMPPGAWQHMFPGEGARLPHLRALLITRCCEQHGQQEDAAGLPKGSGLVGCCPGLQRLVLWEVWWTAEQLSQLAGLSGLRELVLDPIDVSRPGVRTQCAAGLEVVVRLTGLERLRLSRCILGDPPLYLTQLRQLTHLEWEVCENKNRTRCRTWTCEAPGDKPVWRKLLQHHLDYGRPAAKRAAAAALAELT